MHKRILVIEDNPVNLELMTDLLEGFGFTVLAARGGAQGIDLVRQEKLDLIICDVQMPGMDGYEVANYLKRDPMLRRIPLVAVTALAMVGDRESVLTAGFDGYIDKPISPELFRKQVEGFMEK